MPEMLPGALNGRDFIQLDDLTPQEVDDLLALANEMKREQRTFTLPKRTFLMLFFNYSLRTRTSMEIGARQLGIEPITLDLSGDQKLEWQDGLIMDSDSPEHVKDAARVLSRYADAIGIRSYPPMVSLEEDRKDHLLKTFCKHASVPIVNLESANAHPCQGLGDLMTLRELFPSGMKGKRVVLTWTPHPAPLTQSTANTFLSVAARTGADVVLAHPDGFDLSDDALAKAREHSSRSGGSFQITNNRNEAFEGADVIYAKSWVSSAHYGSWEAERQQRLRIADSWRVTAESLQHTRRARFMHPLPLRRNVVADDAVVDGPDCVVYQQSENRLHSQKALLVGLLGAKA